METLFIAAREAPARGGRPGGKAVDALRAAPAERPLIWRVQLRKGREEIRRRRIWTTTVIPVQFTPAEVQTLAQSRDL
jgi:hypothetical protein